MAQALIAYALVALAAAWTLRRFWPRRRVATPKAPAKSDGTCENCDCGR